MPVIRLGDLPDIAASGPDAADALVMKKAIGSKRRDPAFALPIDTDALSITYITIWGRHRRLRCDESDRVMFIVAGEGVVQVGEEPLVRVGAGDFVLIPRGTPYEFQGHMTYLVINSPAYREGSDQYAAAGD